jgi:hypothetical protein
VTVDGTKEPTAISALQQQLPDIDKVLIEQVVWDLMDKRILRYLEEVDLYEVAHDSLALRIAEKRSDEEINLLEVKDLIKNQSLIKQEARELFSEKQLEFIEPFLTRIQLNEQEQALIDASKLQLAKDRQRARHLKWFGISTTALVFMIISAFAAYSKMEKDRAEQANTKNERIVNAMDFYDDKYALAFNNGKYGFIDKEGHPNPHIKFEYDKGEPFNVETGLAQMEINENGYYQEYLLDTLGHRHKVIKVASFFNTSGASNSIFSSAELDWLERKLPKGKQQKNILKTITALEKNHTLAQQKLMESIGSDAENLALDFAGIPTENIITIIKNIVENPSIKDRVEILLFKNTHLKQLPASVVAFKNLKWLDCSATPITSLPNALNQLEHLIHLELNNSALRVFPSVIGQLINLNYLSIAGSFDTIPSSIGNLHLLNCLRISGTFDSLPASIGNLQQLQHLHIESNLQHLPVALSQLQRLNKLAIRGVFKEVPTSIGQLQQLKYLHLNGLFTAIPTTISRLQQLNFLNLQGEFEEIPSSIGQLQQLSYLELQGNFSTLPEEIGQLQALKELYILGALQTVPTAIGELGQLQTLVMEGQFRSLPESIGALQNLQELSVFGQLESIPGAIGALRNLKKLDIGGLFSRLPNSIGELQNLTELFVFGKLETLPSSIGELTKLKILKIEGELDTIPSTIGQLQNLKELTVFGQLPQFPQAIRQLSEIKELRISGQFDTIPESIGKFWKLNHLVLKGRFSAVPAGFDQLSRIKYLELISPNLEQLPDLYAFKNLHQFKCTLAKNASYQNNKTMLQTFFKKHPYCKHSFVDEQLNPVVLTK